MKIIQYDVELDEENRPYLVKENEFRSKRVSCNSPDAIVELLNSDRYRLNKKSEERVYILGTNNKFTHANIFLLSKGNKDSSICSPFCIYQRLLLSNSTQFAMIHNHPSGSLTPSREDIQTSKKLKELAKQMRINFVDSLIIGKYNDYFSLRENGYLD